MEKTLHTLLQSYFDTISHPVPPIPMPGTDQQYEEHKGVVQKWKFRWLEGTSDTTHTQMAPKDTPFFFFSDPDLDTE